MTTIAALSDLHLGAPGSYLTLDSVRKKLTASLWENTRGQIDKLLLVGDIIDLTLGRTPGPWIEARRFFAEIFAPGLDIGHVIYIPGNHDHHLWVMLVEY